MDPSQRQLPDQDPTLPAEDDRMSAGQRSLSEALGLSLRVLRWIMVVLVILFIGSGFFRVEEGQVAVVLRWGRITGATPDEQLYGPGPHLAWPYPIEQPLRFPVQREHSVQIETFWRYQPGETKPDEAEEHDHDHEHEHEEAPPDFVRRLGEGLDPKLQGYTLGANRGILHTAWTVRYRVGDVLAFLRNVGEPPSLVRQREAVVVGKFEAADRLVTVCLRNAVVATAAHYTVEEVYGAGAEDQPGRTAESFRAEVEASVNRQLQALRTGLQVMPNGLLLERREPAEEVRKAYEELAKAKQDYLRVVRDAQSKANETVASAEAAKAELVTEAKLYQAQVVQEARADAEILRLLIEEYKGRPAAMRVFLSKRLLEVLGGFLEAAEEKIVLDGRTDGQEREIRVRINRDPEVARQAVLRALEKERQEK